MKEQARNFAIVSHGDQKYGSHPYSVHLDAVAKIARPFGETAEIIAYLHDVVEDTEVTVEEVEAQFGKLVADSVAILTDESGENRKERKSKTYEKMAKVTGETEIALVVKAADRLANMRACVADKNQRLLSVYKSEHPVFRESVFRSNACNEIWSELETIFNA
jgi:(p)ppGpp synthase/HD superfamily hydrolase